MSLIVYFNIHPHHELATVAVIVVKEMIASNKEPNAVGLKTWLKTYQNAKPKVSKS